MDFALTDQQRELQAIARKFATEEIVPRSMELDAQTDPADCYGPDLVRRADELGLRTMAIPEEHGGLGADILTQTLVLEELCTGDIGFGMSLQHAWREGYALAALTTDEQRERFLPEFMADPTYLTSHAVTEAHFGSDAGASSPDPADGPRTTAVLEGDEWVLNGNKRWITNANISRIALVLARTDTTVPWRDGVTMFLVPTDTPGYGIGQVEDKAGIRLNPNAEIILDDVRIPASNVLGEVNRGKSMGTRFAAGSRVKTAAKSLGVAAAATAEARRYAAERIQGGGPLLSHQAIQAEIVDMEWTVEAVRSLMWRTASAVDHGLPEASRMESLVKIAAAETSREVTAAALEIFGSYGIRRGMRIEKLMRDASCLSHLGRALHAARSTLGTAMLAEETGQLARGADGIGSMEGG